MGEGSTRDSHATDRISTKPTANQVSDAGHAAVALS